MQTIRVSESITVHHVKGSGVWTVRQYGRLSPLGTYSNRERAMRSAHSFATLTSF